MPRDREASSRSLGRNIFTGFTGIKRRESSLRGISRESDYRGQYRVIVKVAECDDQ